MQEQTYPTREGYLRIITKVLRRIEKAQAADSPLIHIGVDLINEKLVAINDLPDSLQSDPLRIAYNYAKVVQRYADQPLMKGGPVLDHESPTDYIGMSSALAPLQNQLILSVQLSSLYATLSGSKAG